MKTVTNRDDDSLDDRVRLLDEKVARLEGLLLPKVSEKVAKIQHLESVVEGVHESVEELRESVSSLASSLGSRIVSSERKVSLLAEAVDYKFDEVLDDLKMVKRALRNGDQGPSPKAKVREFEPRGKVHYPMMMEKDNGWRSRENSSGGSPSCSSNSTQTLKGRRRRGCFVCSKDDHLVRDCPYRAMMLAQVIENEDAEPLGSSGATCVSNDENGGEVQREVLGGVGLITPTSGQGRKKSWGERCEDPDSDEDYPPTTRASSSFGGGGLLYP